METKQQNEIQSEEQRSSAWLAILGTKKADMAIFLNNVSTEVSISTHQKSITVFA